MTDTGIGIQPEALPTLFDNFSQADTSITRKFGGTGLGLAISSEIMRAHGGRIEVDTELGEGSTFRLIIPVEHQHSPNPSLAPPPELADV